MSALLSTSATTDEIKAAVQAWRDADLAALQAEKAVAEASFLGPSVRDDLIGDAKLLRSLANFRLAKALFMMRA